MRATFCSTNFAIVQLRRAQPPAQTTTQGQAATTAPPVTKVVTDALTPSGEASEDKLQRYYTAAHGLQNLSALCLSGGGIRSAAFALGVAQGLAKRGLLQNFDYLSTVSGGGYFGSFLTAWVQRRGYAAVCKELGGDFRVTEGSPLQYLRRYTSYLTPERGPFTADTLSVVALYLRNLLLNWLIIIPLVLAIIIAVKAYATVVWSLPATPQTSANFVVAAIFAAGIAALESLRQRPGWESPPSDRFQFQRWVKWMLFVSGLAASIAALKYLQYAEELKLPALRLPIPDDLGATFDLKEALEALKPPTPNLLGVIAFPAMIIGAINGISWVFAFFIAPAPNANEISTRLTVRATGIWSVWNFFSFTLSGAIAGAVLGCSFYLAAELFWRFDLAALVILCAGPPVVVGAVFLGEAIHLGLTSYAKWSDGEREWLATAAGYHGRTAVSWTLLTLCVFGGSYLVFHLYQDFGFSKQLASLGTTGGAAGLIAAWLGKATATAATIRERYDTWKNWSANIVLSIATPLFLVIAIGFLSAGVNAVLIGRTLTFSSITHVGDIFPLDPTELSTVLIWKFALMFAGCMVLCLAASRAINTNRFSLHGLYRNRLIRAFLGGSRDPAERRQNPLSQFDEHDNLNLCDIWPNKHKPGTVPPQLLVINCALNVLSSSNLAWQERKALSFTCTPRSVGAYALGNWTGYYRRASEYADKMTLGTAMTISGAAVSPNMGYHSSPALSLLMTFFNVRLGAWLGNPGPNGARVYQHDGPRDSAIPLIQEALGMTNEDRSYVYLSDGGHFENLGLYEMVQRRCRFIVVSDAGWDPGITFEDLGNAVRKISIDLNVRIEFDTLQISPRKNPPVTGSCIATARIYYPETGAPVGQLLYIKPSYRGTEPASVRGYAEANPSFPHEPTTDQTFGKSQFEAYRALGEYIVQTMDGDPARQYTSVESFISEVALRQRVEALRRGDD